MNFGIQSKMCTLEEKKCIIYASTYDLISNVVFTLLTQDVDTHFNSFISVLLSIDKIFKSNCIFQFKFWYRINSLLADAILFFVQGLLLHYCCCFTQGVHTASSSDKENVFLPRISWAESSYLRGKKVLRYRAFIVYSFLKELGK